MLLQQMLLVVLLVGNTMSPVLGLLARMLVMEEAAGNVARRCGVGRGCVVVGKVCVDGCLPEMMMLWGWLFVVLQLRRQLMLLLLLLALLFA